MKLTNILKEIQILRKIPLSTIKQFLLKYINENSSKLEKEWEVEHVKESIENSKSLNELVDNYPHFGSIASAFKILELITDETN